MDDKSFVNLISDDVLNEIKIDTRLRAPFKRVVKKLQAYFNANGYTAQRDYKTFFEENLIGKNFKIYVSDEPSKIGALGFYSKAKQCICIDEGLLEKPHLEPTLCHEFTHFLVMNDKSVPSGFINEAQTEMFTRQIYPISRSYEPQVRMMEFANILMNKANNFSLFLQGGIDSMHTSSMWNDFYNYVSLYQEKFANTSYKIGDAVKDEDYISAQRYIIRNNIHSHLINSFDDYEEILEKLSYAPVKDEEWMNDFITEIEENIIRNIRDKKIREITLSKFKEYRDIKNKLSIYTDANNFVIDFNGSKYIVNRFGEVRDQFTNTLVHKSYTGFFSFGDTNSINIKKTLDKRDVLLRHERELKSFLKGFSFCDEMALTSISDKENLIRLEKVELPIIDFAKGNPIYVYVAVYPDRVEVLNNVTKLEKIQNVNLCKYIGQVDGAICGKPMDKIDGTMFANVSVKRFNFLSKAKYREELEPMLSKEMIDKIIDDHRKSDEYDVEDESNISENALYYYFEKKYKELSAEERKKYEEKAKKTMEKFVVSIKDGNVDVSLMYGNSLACIGLKQVLIDKKGNGLYNEYIDALSNKNVNKQRISTSDEKKQNQIPESLKERYNALDVEIKNLFRQNKEKPIPNYFEKFKHLIDEQNEIKIEMDLKGLKRDKEKTTNEDVDLYEKIYSIRQDEEKKKNRAFENECVEEHRRRL